MVPSASRKTFDGSLIATSVDWRATRLPRICGAGISGAISKTSRARDVIRKNSRSPHAKSCNGTDGVIGVGTAGDGDGTVAVGSAERAGAGAAVV